MAKIFFTDTDELLDIRYDNVFKAVFTRDTAASNGALSRLISAFISQDVIVQTINANEPPIDTIHDRQIRFDIYCKTKDGEMVNVEMTFNPDPFEPVRLEFLAGKLFTRQDIRGSKKSYNDLKEAYQIAILGKEKFFSDESFLHTFQYYDPEKQVSLNGKSRIITVELSKLEKVAKKPTEEMSIQENWAFYFRYLTDKSKRRKINEILEKNEGIAMASEALISISKDEKEWAHLMSEYKYELDTQSKLVHARREGEKKGEQKGKQLGRQEIIDLLKNGKSPEEIIREHESSSN